MLAVWSLVPLPFLKPAWTSGSSQFMYCWSLAWRILKWSEVKLLSRVRLFATPWTVAYKAPLSMEFSRQEYRSGLPFPSPGDLPDPGTWESGIAGRRFTVWVTREAPNLVLTVRRVYAPRFCLVHNKDLERRKLKPSARHSSRVLPCYRTLSITLLVCEISTTVW